MAIIKNGILSEFRGSIGNITGKIIRGRNILSRKPAFRKVLNDPDTLKRLNRFKLSVKLGAALGYLPEVKTVWKSLTPDGLNYFSYLVQSNYRQIADGLLTNTNVITPYGGFPFSVGNTAITSTVLNIEVLPLKNMINFNLSVEKNIKLFSVVYLYGAKSEQAGEYAFMPLSHEAQVLKLEDPITFNRTFLKAEEMLFESFNNHKVYCALITLDSNNTPVNYSSTLCLE